MLAFCSRRLRSCAVDWTAKPTFADDRLARNVILFIGDAGGIPTINAAAIYKYRAPRQLFIHTMPYVALVETSSASEWVTDSAAAMTAMVTGHKTHNGVLSQSDGAVRGVKDGEALKTILEHAEERGLSTGVVSNSSVASATPAACYAHVNDRRKEGEIFVQALTPRFGDGIDLVIGPDRAEIHGIDSGIGSRYSFPCFASQDVTCTTRSKRFPRVRIARLCCCRRKISIWVGPRRSPLRLSPATRRASFSWLSPTFTRTN